ncbi:hypothetical protein MMPV_007620 [Pyropia vietnamensis]
MDADEDYYDIDAILATSDPIFCAFNVDADGLAYLDPASALASSVSAGRRSLVTLELPRAYDGRARAELAADAPHVSLSGRASHYYRWGGRLGGTLDGEAGLAPALAAAASARAWRIVDAATYAAAGSVTAAGVGVRGGGGGGGLLAKAAAAAAGGGGGGLLSKLDADERGLYFAAREAALAAAEWRRGAAERVVAPATAVLGKRRVLADPPGERVEGRRGRRRQ